MIRSSLIFLGVLILITLALTATGDAGQASLIWLGFRIDMAASTGMILIGVFAFLAVSFWNLVLWLTRAPQRSAARRAEARRRQGDEILTRGFLSVATGDGVEARRCAVKAVDLNDNVALVRILGAMAAEAADDPLAAGAAYQAMLSVGDLKMAGLKGLSQLALARGDRQEAVRLSEDALALPKPSMWAFKTLFEARLAEGNWENAINLIDGALSRKLISPVYSERAKTALMAAQASRLSLENPTKHDADLALRAAKQQPGFTPAAVLAAEALSGSAKTGRAEDILEQAWAANPHPAIWMAYRDLVKSETPRERSQRLQHLIDRNANSTEARILGLERVLINGTAPDLKAAMAALEPDLGDDTLTRRLCGLMARACLSLRDMDGAASGSPRPLWPNATRYGQTSIPKAGPSVLARVTGAKLFSISRNRDS